jgi:hypothetical protein
MNEVIGDRIASPADRDHIRFGQENGTILAFSMKTKSFRTGKPGDRMLVIICKHPLVFIRDKIRQEGLGGSPFLGRQTEHLCHFLIANFMYIIEI